MTTVRLALAGALALAACTERVPLVTVDAGGASTPADGPTGVIPRPDAARFDVRLGGDASCRDASANIGASVQFERQELMFALDRSTSMIATRLGSSYRLAVAQMTVRELIRRYQGLVRFGYEDFPFRCEMPGQTCCVGHVVPPQRDSLFMIDRYMNCQSSACFDLLNDAPTAEALRTAANIFGGPDPISRYVLLVTDGDPSCGTSACESAIYQAVKLADAGVKTIVVALGDEVKTSMCLDMIGRAGQARSAAPFFTWAADDTQLARAMQDALSSVASCGMRVSGPPDVNPDRLSVTAEGATVPRDPNLKEGWAPDPTRAGRIVFYGSWCDKMRSGQVQERDVTVTAHCQVCGLTTFNCR
jgi:hypothetical protein